MPNIVINNFCNQNCQYCFANEIMAENKKMIDFDSFKKIVDFLKKSNIGNIGLIGGEPSLHPQLTNFIDYLKENNIHPRILTNGTNLLSYDINKFKNCSLLININNKNMVNEKNYQSTLLALNELDKINANIVYGINLFDGMLDYDYFINLLIQHNKSFCRCSYVAPTKIEDFSDKEKYYLKGKDLFLSFCRDMNKYNLSIDLDCNKIPLCYFSQEELDLINKTCSNYNSVCNPAVDINMDFTVTSCFGAYDPINLFDFNNYSELERYLFAKKVLPKIFSNNSGRCKDCQQFEKLICQGGCLAFSKNNQ